ncbi:hypothetical protein [Sanyastnella coralliicola]|uniref:hypothetical protein n=1 Tax=Sanyastnella coralliicola TaxID=3069118 RepID=UPI0027B9B3D7|nr:hypothetical protein [Longitalea sp. SCSIO 12813]
MLTIIVFFALIISTGLFIFSAKGLIEMEPNDPDLNLQKGMTVGFFLFAALVWFLAGKLRKAMNV